MSARPEEIQPDFFVPSSQQSTNNSLEFEASSKAPVSFNDIVRILVFYDMGWSTRGTGRNYNSLNGFGAIIGHFSGLVLDYSTCNRKCRKCDSSNNPPDHDCRKNFYGSAKAMEPQVAKKIVVESDVLRINKVEVGVLIGDDDSSTIDIKHPIIKQSDVNHTSGGVKKQLYSIQRNHGELTKDRINYLHRCFMYAVAQNRGNSQAMAEAIRCIPYHTFNDHSKCGNWCGFIRDKENYDHKVIPGGFEDKNLFTDLKNIFEKLAENAKKFSSGASSNSNESLNATMMSKHPKSRCYSTTASADFRYACAVGQKNLGEKYTQEILKTKRNELKRNRAALRYRKENVEGVTYESNCALLSEPAIQTEEQVTCPDFVNDPNENPVVFFDLETSGLDKNWDILQIAAKYDNDKFNTYVTPTQQIAASATAANGLINCHGDLMYHGIKVNSVPIRLALVNLLEWLKSIGKKGYLAAHNLSFDGPRLIRMISKYSLIDDYSQVLCGFIDTLEVVRKTTNKRGKGGCSIGELSNLLKINSAGAHNAIYDCDILSKIIYKLNITSAILIGSARSYEEKVGYWKNQAAASQHLATLLPLQSTVGTAIRTKLALVGYTMEILQTIYDQSGKNGLHQQIKEKLKIKGVAGIRSSSINKISDWFINKQP
ncbi:uncharacterized protein LOC125501888 [Athalia rosae]|uniref:uncharacterized protein LOC125501888 n=1 Tax=Athalia rosae TaxID=37344 RepID=UPI0020341D5C|nr:uncharacterized protein LOC125501888 [Athalia rosae]